MANSRLGRGYQSDLGRSQVVCIQLSLKIAETCQNLAFNGGKRSTSHRTAPSRAQQHALSSSHLGQTSLKWVALIANCGASQMYSVYSCHETLIGAVRAREEDTEKIGLAQSRSWAFQPPEVSANLRISFNLLDGSFS